MKSLGQGFCQKEYSFEVRNDEGRNHFRRISRRYPSLYFILAYHAANIGQHGSYLIRDGRSRWHLVPDEEVESRIVKHGYDYDKDSIDTGPGYNEDNELAYWEANWELMEETQERWLRLVYKRLGVRSPRSPKQ